MGCPVTLTTRVVHTLNGRSPVRVSHLGGLYFDRYYKDCTGCSKEIGPWPRLCTARKVPDKCRSCRNRAYGRTQ